jgi:hypothetical protein
MNISRLSISDPILDQGDVILSGPKGCILLHDIMWCPADRIDLMEIYYWESWSVLMGAYHCCFSIPGKVLLLPPDDPRCSVS